MACYPNADVTAEVPYASPARDIYPRFSLNGRWVAFTTDQSGSREVHVRSFPDGERETVVSTNGGIMPAWSGDGRRLYFRRGSSVWFSELGEADGELVPRTPELLFDGPFRANENFDVSDDEQVFLLNRYREDQRSRVDVILNWTTWLEEQLAER